MEEEYKIWEVKAGVTTKIKLGESIFVLEKQAKEQTEKAQVSEEGAKVCNECKQWKPYSEFWHNKSLKDGYMGKCKKCIAKVKKKWSQKNKMKSTQTEKFCFHCKTTKPMSEFYTHNASKDGFQTYCKECSKKPSRDSQRKSKQNNKERTPAPIFIPTQNVIERQHEKPETKISDASSPDALPLTDSGTVIEDKVDEKKKNWTLFKTKEL